MRPPSPSTAQPVPKSTAPQRNRNLLLAGGVAAVGVVVAILAFSGGDEGGSIAPGNGAAPGATAVGPTAATGGPEVALDATRPATEDLPYSFSYPSSWNTIYSDVGAQALSPAPIEWSYPSDIDWSEISELDLSQLVGVFDRGFYGVDLADFFAPEFPISDSITVSSPTETTVDGFPALRMEGTLYESGETGPALPVVVEVIQVREGTGVYLVFFGSDQAFDPALFDQIVRTLRFDPALLEARFPETTPSS
jgi:hypothetical protein